jgi:beta-phosphoglucomutase-like phosphatase (HAD superfamily)
VSVATATVPSKPAPDVYEDAAGRLGVDPRDSVAVEDSEHGAEAAANAGMHAIAYRSDANAEASLTAAETVATGSTELHEVLLELATDL